jgi:hypothetical protein
MKRLVLSLLVLPAAWFALVPSTARSQSQPQVAAPPLSSEASASQTAPAKTPQATERKPAKVWTNDDIDELRSNQTVSVVGNNAGIKKSSAPSRPDSNEKNPAWYRRQLAPLRAEVEKLDPQIAKIKAFISGENVGEPQPYRHNLPVTPQDQLKQMEMKRQADAAKIEDLLDRARHNGIEPGALR